jgi:tRNA threonylcarbamoyladenosine biosynthesis protein TsaB
VKLLAADTTAAVATVALFDGENCILELEADGTKKHAETVAPLIDRLLSQTGTNAGEIDMFAVDIGPGSFTGVRIGVSLINAMAFALQKQVVPVDALLTLYTACGEPSRPVCAMIDARNGNAYAALYQAGETLTEPCAVEVEPFFQSLPPDTLFYGDAHTQTNAYPRAKAVGLAALKRLQTAQDAVEPVYLRASQAERLKKKDTETQNNGKA